MKVLPYIFLIFMSLPVNAEKITDLGVVGFTCDITQDKKEVNSLMKSRHRQVNIQQKAFIGYQTRLPQHTKEKTVIKRYPLEKSTAFTGKKIFVFSAMDSVSIEKAKKISADYGVCVGYTCFNDIKQFRQETGATYPIQLGNDAIVNFLKLSSYPALVSVKDDAIEIQTGF